MEREVRDGLSMKHMSYISIMHSCTESLRVLKIGVGGLLHYIPFSFTHLRSLEKLVLHSGRVGEIENLEGCARLRHLATIVVLVGLLVSLPPARESRQAATRSSSGTA